MKRNFLLALVFGLFTTVFFAQNSDVKVGDVFVIEEVENNNYKHINFPKNNFIIKKGGIANYNKVKGQEVEITSIKEKKDGTLVATIKLTSDKAFFNSHKYLTVDIAKAIENNELSEV